MGPAWLPLPWQGTEAAEEEEAGQEEAGKATCPLPQWGPEERRIEV